MFALFIKGFILGFAIAAPIGPISILCIQRTLHNGFKIGLMSGVGAALADGTYGLIAGFGLTAISSLLIAEQLWISVIGGLFLLYLGVKLILTPPKALHTKTHNDKSAWHACGTTYLLTLANPLTILSFIAVFAGLGIGTTNPKFIEATAFVLGITVGSIILFLLLTSVTAFILHKRMNPKLMQIINWVSGSMIVAFGLMALKVAV